MSFKESFTAKEWHTLQCVPWWVFCTVAGTDRMLDLKEISSLLILLSGKVDLDPVTREILPASVAELAEIQIEATKEFGLYWQKLKEVADLLDQKMTPDQAMNFKETMLRLAYSIAEASGGFLGLGEKVSWGEKSVIKDLAMALKVI